MQTAQGFWVGTKWGRITCHVAPRFLAGPNWGSTFFSLTEDFMSLFPQSWEQLCKGRWFETGKCYFPKKNQAIISAVTIVSNWVSWLSWWGILSETRSSDWSQSENLTCEQFKLHIICPKPITLCISFLRALQEFFFFFYKSHISWGCH